MIVVRVRGLGDDDVDLLVQTSGPVNVNVAHHQYNNNNNISNHNASVDVGTLRMVMREEMSGMAQNPKFITKVLLLPPHIPPADDFTCHAPASSTWSVQGGGREGGVAR